MLIKLGSPGMGVYSEVSHMAFNRAYSQESMPYCSIDAPILNASKNGHPSYFSETFYISFNKAPKPEHCVRFDIFRLLKIKFLINKIKIPAEVVEDAT